MQNRDDFTPFTIGRQCSLSVQTYNIMRIEGYSAIREILYTYNNEFHPTLSEKIADLDAYAERLHNKAIIYEAKNDEGLGFIAFYANDVEAKIAYLTQIAVRTNVKNRGIGKRLLEKCVNISKLNGMSKLKLEVYKDNLTAIHFYERNGFEFCGEASSESMYMLKIL